MFTFAAAVAAGRESRMLARSRRLLFRVNLIARRTTSTSVQSKPLPYFQL
ncbi:hypothetical protein OROGR_005023 [Orobanche gracilis]